MTALASSDVTITGVSTVISGPQKRKLVTLAFGDGALTYPSGGVPLPTYASWGFKTKLDYVNLVDPASASGIVWKYDQANNKLRGYETTAAGTISSTVGGSTITVTDDDSAASNGVALYLHIDEVTEQGSYIGHLEFVSPTNADGYFAINNGGPQVRVQDDDAAATAGFALYFDEDASPTDNRIIADIDNVGDADVFIMCSNGELIRIVDTDTPGTPGVQLYFDEDAANDYERLLFVSPTNAAGTGATDDTVGAGAITSTLTGTDASMSELDTSDAPAAQTLYVEAVGW